MILKLNIIINKREGERGVEDDANGLAELLEDGSATDCNGENYGGAGWGRPGGHG